MLLILLTAATLAIVALAAYAATRPDTFRIARTTGIKAAPDAIFPLIEDLRSNEAWSPYYRKDPAMKGSYSGPARGAGAAFEFEGNKDVGAGRVSILDSAPPGRVRMRLQMFKPFSADNEVEFTLAPRGEATEVTWAMQGRVPFLGKLMHLVVDCDSMVGRDFEAGLANLKAIVENRGVHA